jgi:NAD(P)-dependent dehydrogenase (short-subunit alcohol dehydrogenase family)
LTATRPVLRAPLRAALAEIIGLLDGLATGERLVDFQKTVREPKGHQPMTIALRPISEQVAVVMGASSGIGRATALELARRGATVVVAARGEPALDTLVAEIRAGGGMASAVVADVTIAHDMHRVAEHALTSHGRLDTWVHVAGVLLVAGFENTTPEEFGRVLQVNLLGQVHGANAALPALRERGGAFISISSMGAKRSIPLQSAYCASKHGLDGFLEAFRIELQHDAVPVSVTQILPATINTPLFDNARTKIGIKPTAPPPGYSPASVAQAVAYAAEHPVRDIVVGGAAKVIILGHTISPRLLDVAFRRFGYQLHDTGEPKASSAPDNLDHPLPDQARVEGSIDRYTLNHSAYTWWQTHRPVSTAIRALVGPRSRSERNRPEPTRPPSARNQQAAVATPTVASTLAESVAVAPIVGPGEDAAGGVMRGLR